MVLFDDSVRGQLVADGQWIGNVQSSVAVEVADLGLRKTILRPSETMGS